MVKTTKLTTCLLLTAPLFIVNCGKGGGGGGGNAPGPNGQDGSPREVIDLDAKTGKLPSVQPPLSKTYQNTLSEADLKEALSTLEKDFDHFTDSTIPMADCDGDFGYFTRTDSYLLTGTYADPLGSFQAHLVNAPDNASADKVKSETTVHGGDETYGIAYGNLTLMKLMDDAEWTHNERVAKFGGNDSVLYGHFGLETRTDSESLSAILGRTFEYDRKSKVLTVNSFHYNTHSAQLTNSATVVDMQKDTTTYWTKGESADKSEYVDAEARFQRNGDAITSTWRLDWDTSFNIKGVAPGSGTETYKIETLPKLSMAACLKHQ